MVNINKTFGEFLKSRRESLGLSTRQLSFKTGHTHSRISNVERGVQMPIVKTESLKRLAKGLELSEAETVWFMNSARMFAGRLPESVDNDTLCYLNNILTAYDTNRCAVREILKETSLKLSGL